MRADYENDEEESAEKNQRCKRKLKKKNRKKGKVIAYMELCAILDMTESVNVICILYIV